MNKKFRITPTFIFCLFFVALFGIATVSAVPPLPQEFYGTVTVNGGVPAPVHSEVRAQVNGADRGSIITDVAGSYGGTGNFVLRLVVQATEADMSGPAIVTFYVNGAKADQQVSYVAGTSTSLALTVGSGGTMVHWNGTNWSAPAGGVDGYVNALAVSGTGTTMQRSSIVSVSWAARRRPATARVR